MTFETGIFYECYKYVNNYNLPIKFVVEDNGLSTNTNKKLGKQFQKNLKVLFTININDSSLIMERVHGYYFNYEVKI